MHLYEESDTHGALPARITSKFMDHARCRTPIFMHQGLPRCIIPITYKVAPELVILGWDTGLNRIPYYWALSDLVEFPAISRSVWLALAWALSNCFTSKRRNPHCAFHTACSSHACFGTLDLLFASEYPTIGIASPGLVTIQSPIIPLRRTCLPQGRTNTGETSHEHLTLLGVEDPNVAWLRFQGHLRGSQHPQIHLVAPRIHLSRIHRVLSRLHHSGAMVSAKEQLMEVPASGVLILRHVQLRRPHPDDSVSAKTRDWPSCCEALTDV